MSTFRDDLASYFKAREGEWLDGMELAHVSGCYAWRSRISDCRTQLGMSIENRQRRVGKRVISEYRYQAAGQQRLPLPNTAEAA